MGSKKTRMLWLTAAILAMMAGIILGGAAALYHDLPPIRQLESYSPSAITRIYSADNLLLAELFTERRDPAALADIPKALIDAVLAVEDRQFYDHPGVNLRSILRALITDLKAGGFVQGASTITQQLVKTLFLTHEKSVARKLREALLALQLERRYTKDEILALYLNQIYLGSGAYGVGAAARIFFGKQLSELTLAECALIAAMPRAPSRYSPLVNAELALRRRNLVLKQMAATGIVSPEGVRQASAEPLNLVHPKPQTLRAPYFTAYIGKILEDQIGADLLYQGGLSITSTLDFDLQTAAESALAQGLHNLEQRMAKAGLPTQDLQGALVALNPATGEIVAMTGGRDYGASPYNRAVEAQRQPGSAFKPIIYALAVTRGMAQNDLIRDTPVVYGGASGEWRPANFSNTFEGEITLRRALANSRNIPAIRLVEQLGLAQLGAFSEKMGLPLPASGNLTLALGTAEVTLLNLTSAYGTFANQGIRIHPRGIQTVRDAKGHTLWAPQSRQEAILTPPEAAVVSDMLRAVVLEGTARSARTLPLPVAGKTGTSDQTHDALFVGFSPSLAAGVWVGRDGSQTLGARETGARAALPIWMSFMESASAYGVSGQFVDPPGTLRVPMDPVSGLSVPHDSPRASSALFIKGTEPPGP